MDADRFDALSRRVAVPTTRRATLSALTASGLLTALGLGRAAPATRAAQGQVCRMSFMATVRVGPSLNQTLAPGATQPGQLQGELSFALSETGNLEQAALKLLDGTRLPVVGQATGHALQLRITIDQRAALVALGVGAEEIAEELLGRSYVDRFWTRRENLNRIEAKLLRGLRRARQVVPEDKGAAAGFGNETDGDAGEGHWWMTDSIWIWKTSSVAYSLLAFSLSSVLRGEGRDEGPLRNIRLAESPPHPDRICDAIRPLPAGGAR